MRTLLLTSFILLMTFASCQDKRNIVVTGQITEEQTGKPISKAEVVVLCWYMSSIDDASFKKLTVLTDQNGNYKVSFDKGHQVDVASKTNGFLANRSYNELKDNKIKVSLRLTRAKDNPTLIKYLSTEQVHINITDKTPFLRVRFYSADTSTSLDLNKVETYGFDFRNQRTNTDTSKCDIWFQPIHKEEQPKVIVANSGGGILPVYANEIKSSFFYEKMMAPTTGYLHEYKLEGNEEGFFVLCRDGKTYGKLIFVKSEDDVSSPDGKGGFYKEFGREFSCLYQPNGTTDLSYSTPDIDLEDFLVDSRLR
jgi:hypothetical protein